MKYLQLVKKHGWKLFLPEDPPLEGQSQAVSEPSTLQVQSDNSEFNEEVSHQHLSRLTSLYARMRGVTIKKRMKM